MQNITIVDRVVERLKLQPLGDLITEEDLHDIVKEAIPKVFFEKRVIVSGSGHNQSTKSADALIVDVMRELLEASAKVAVQKWLVENADVVAEHWKKVIDKGLLNYVQKLQNAAATTQMTTALKPMIDSLNSERSRLGLGQIFLNV